MLRKLLRSSRATAAPAAIPEGQRVYAIGDIHGCLSLLEELLELIVADDAGRADADTSLVFIGDLIDRGPASAQVVERLRNGSMPFPARYIMGNHEELFLAAIDGDDAALRTFRRCGGRETAISYGIAEDEYDQLDYPELRERLLVLVPTPHREFLADFEDMAIIGGYAFVHAGVRPGIPFGDQRPSSLRWIRDPFLSHRGPLEKCVVHGHTIVESPIVLAHRIGIDTGAFVHGRLTSVGLESTDRWVVQAGVAGANSNAAISY